MLGASWWMAEKKTLRAMVIAQGARFIAFADRLAMCIIFVVTPATAGHSLDDVMTQVKALVTVCVRLRQSALPEAKQLSIFFPSYLTVQVMIYSVSRLLRSSFSS